MLRWLVPADVPVHRPSVGAMRVTSGSLMPPPAFKPYVYQGTGEDQFPETYEPPPPPKPKAPTAEEYRARERERAREVARMKRAAAKRRQRYRPVVNIEDISTWANRYRFTPQPEPVFLDDLDIEQAPPEPQPVREPRKPVRPAPGWKPLAGADLDSLLDEIE